MDVETNAVLLFLPLVVIVILTPCDSRWLLIRTAGPGGVLFCFQALIGFVCPGKLRPARTTPIFSC